MSSTLNTPDLQTFHLPASVQGSTADMTLAQEIIRAWRRDGIFQIAIQGDQLGKTEQALAESRHFFSQPFAWKSQHVSDATYSGYIASGEEVTAGENDFSEIYTVCPDIPLHDERVRAKWPCHGPAPWPSDGYRQSMTAFMQMLGELGEKILQLTALGLGLEDMHTLTQLTQDGWHHMRVLRFPSATASNRARGIGAHTDYGLLVLAAQDDVGGLYIRPPVEGERRNRNWLPNESMAGMYENDDPWTFVKPVQDVVTCFPGDILQFLTDGYLLSTPHKVKLHEMRERFALAYFHEPNFTSVVQPLWGEGTGRDSIHYGSHFTNMFMRSYPDRVTTRRIITENRLAFFADVVR